MLGSRPHDANYELWEGEFMIQVSTSLVIRPRGM